MPANRLHRCLAAIAAATMLAVAACDAAPTATSPRHRPPSSSDNPFQIGRTLVIPHAGGDGLFPENTLFAYRQSMAMGADVIDVDVRLAADGVLVAFHDATLDRTTDGTGPMHLLTSAELATLDAGWAFERDGTFPFRGTGVTVPTIEDILLAFPDVPATLDLKDPGPAPVGPVCDLLRSLGRTHDVYVGTDTNEQTGVFRDTCPEVPTSGTSEERQARRAALDEARAPTGVRQLVSQPPFAGRNGRSFVTEEYLDFAHANGTAVLTWVVDDPDELAELIDLGIDGVYTRRPDVMLDVLRQMGEI